MIAILWNPVDSRNCARVGVFDNVRLGVWLDFEPVSFDLMVEGCKALKRKAVRFASFVDFKFDKRKKEKCLERMLLLRSLQTQ